MPPPPTHTFWLLPAIAIFYLEAGRSPGCGPRLPRQLYIMRGMLKVTVINTVSRKTLHLQNRFDSSVCLQCRALLPRPPPPWSCEPWLLLWCQLFHRDLRNGSDEWGPVRLHSLGGLESIHLSVTLPAMTVTNAMQAADNTPVHYKKEKRKKRRDGKSYACHLSMLHSSTLLL